MFNFMFVQVYLRIRIRKGQVCIRDTIFVYFDKGRNDCEWWVINPSDLVSVP